MDVALVTYPAAPELDPDDEPLRAALSAHGLRVEAVPWDAPAFDWSGPKISLLRSTWDYHLRRDEFLAWAARASLRGRLHNPFPVVAWNTDKRYLKQLEASGVPVVPTEWRERGAIPDLRKLLESRRWPEAIVKPVVSAGAHRTFHVRSSSIGSDLAAIEALAEVADLMVQPYMSEVERSGERSVVWIAGEITHSVRKRPILLRAADPDWREADSADTTLGERDLALAAIRASGFDPLYARADMVRDESGRLFLMELEMTEPTLFFTHCPAAADRLASAIAGLLGQRP
jgi:hypothetical protein